MVTVYTKPACTQCRFTQKELDRTGIPYTTLDVTKNPDALQHVQALGYLQAPVVETDTEHWSGFKPDKIKALAN